MARSAFLKDDRGVAAIEYAILAIPFFIILTAIIETSVIFFAGVNLQHASVKAARIVRTGEASTKAYSQTEFKNLLCKDLSSVLKCNALQIDLQKYNNYSELPTTVPIVSGKLDTGSFRYDDIKPGDLVALRTFYEWPLFFDLLQKYLSKLSDGNALISSTLIIKVEPFSKV